MIARLDHVSAFLLDRFQRDFPLVPEPFHEAGAAAGTDAAGALARYRQMVADGLISRIGAIVAPNAVGSSTLAAMAVEPGDMDRVAGIVNAERGVNHNYQREHDINLWFVVAEPDEASLEETLARISARSGLQVRDLRLEKPFHLDLGFSLTGESIPKIRQGNPDLTVIETDDARLLEEIAQGIPLIERPFRQIGIRLGWTEERVIERLSILHGAHVMRRFGVVVRHRKLGMRANAMAVWDIADADVDAAGKRLAGEAGVTLCYRRRRAEDWRYNLYCMVHGTERTHTQATVDRLNAIVAPVSRGHEILFSTRCFKQSGRRFRDAGVAA